MSKLEAVLGCDPGAKGALCILASDSTIEFLDFSDQPLVITTWFKEMQEKYDIKIIMIENVHSIFGVSAKSNFNFGFNVGILHGIFRSSSIGLDLVQPKVWQKSIGVTTKGKDIKKDVASIATRLYPLAQIYTPRGRLLDGRSDALMVAHYTRLKYLGNTNT
jgi:hypothetical protein